MSSLCVRVLSPLFVLLISAIAVQRPLHRSQPRLPAVALSDPKKEILLFWSVSARDEVVDLVAANIKLARQQWGAQMDVFLVHYDLQASAWNQRLGCEWYKDNINFSAELPGFKFQLLQTLVARGSVDLSSYKWVWVLDEDICFDSRSLPGLLPLADRSKALILTPAFTQPDSLPYMDIQLPDEGCLYRYTNFVEVLMPLLRSEVAALILQKCDGCIHNHSVWGLDGMWCSWTARRLDRNRETACAVLDAAPMQHLDFRTLLHKYLDNGSYNDTFKLLADEDAADTSQRFSADYVPASLVRTIECVPDSV